MKDELRLTSCEVGITIDDLLKIFNMKPQDLKLRTKQFAVSVLRFIEKVPNKQPYFALVNQISRSSASVGANYRAVSRAKSKLDFINKLKIVEEECDETMCFLEIFIELLPENKKELELLHKEANELLSIVVASIKTARNNN